MTATFMPKPLFEDNASGMHVHQSLLEGRYRNLFYNAAHYAGLGNTGRYYIGGLLKHAWALCGLCAPTTNSYRRLVPGYEAPINLVYSQRNRSACCRIPMYSPNARQAGPFAGPLVQRLSGVLRDADGRHRRIEPHRPRRADRQELVRPAANRRKEVRLTPGSLEGSARRTRGRPRVPVARRCLHRGRHRDLARLQAQEGGRRDRAASAPLRVPPLLRYLSISARVPRPTRGGHSSRASACRQRRPRRSFRAAPPRDRA